jgi:hypothetical protein
MRAVILRSLVVIGTGALILAGVLYVASTVDARPPEVLDIQLTQSLGDEPDRALITTSIEITFNEPVETDGAARAVSFDPPIAGSVSWSGSTMIFTPQEPLELETAYTLTIDPGIRDLAGNEMAEVPSPYTFVTAGRPVVAGTEPADGAEEVPVDAIIGISFSTLMDTASVEGQLELRPPFPHELRWSGEVLEIVPIEPLRPAREYSLTLGGSATDVAGVAVGEPLTITFRTVAPGMEISMVVPAGGVDGIAPRTPIAVVFDRPIDPDTVTDDLLEISPSTAGSLDVVALPDDPDGARVLRFTPSSPLPANTTFELELRPGIRSEAGGGIAEPYRWTFTTGAPQAALSNQVLFLTDRSGVANVWAMNPDGTGQHQVSAELTPILDYAVAPNGSSLVVGDGRRLVFLRPDGSDRQVLTEDGFVEFDPAYAPNGSQLAFARAAAEGGDGLGLWTWEVGTNAARPVELLRDVRPGASPAPTGADGAPAWLRAPRFSPDGLALAFVDLTGAVGIVELPAQRLTRIAVDAASAPAWLPNSAAFLVTVQTDRAEPEPEPFVAPVHPFHAGEASDVGLVHRSGTSLESVRFGGGQRVGAVAADGRVAYLDAEGTLSVAISPGSTRRVPPDLAGVRIGDIVFGPGQGAAVIAVIGDDDAPGSGVIERIDLDDGSRTPLVRGGWSVRWLP